MATSSEDVNLCTICQSELNETSTCLPCGHTFCSTCVSDLLRQEAGELMKCPNCRTEFEKIPYCVINNSILPTADINSGCCFLPEEQPELSESFCSTCNIPVYVDEDGLHVTHETESLLSVLSRERKKLAKTEAVIKKLLTAEVSRLHRIQRQSKALESKMVELEDVINSRYDAIVKAVENVRLQALEVLCQQNKVIRHENEKTIKKQTQAVAGLFRMKFLTEKAKEKGNKRELLELGKLTRLPNFEKQEGVTLKLPVMFCDVAWDKVQYTIKHFIGRVEVATVESSMEEMLPDITFDRKTITESFSELLGVRNTETSPHILTIFYTAEGDYHGAAEASDSGKILQTHDDVPFEQYQNVKRFENGYNLEPVVRPGVISLVSKSTKDVHFRLNSGILGMGKIRTVDMISNKPLQTKGKTLLKIVCSTPTTFDVSEDGKAFVILEKPESPGQRQKVRLFTKKNSPLGSLYEPPRLPFSPADIIFYHLEGRQHLLIADEASDTIHVVDVRGSHLVFLRYLALGPCLLSQPVALHADPSDKLWVTCRGGVYAFRPRSLLTKKTAALRQVKQEITSSPGAAFRSTFPNG